MNFIYVKRTAKRIFITQYYIRMLIFILHFYIDDIKCSENKQAKMQYTTEDLNKLLELIDATINHHNSIIISTYYLRTSFDNNTSLFQKNPKMHQLLWKYIQKVENYFQKAKMPLEDCILVIKEIQEGIKLIKEGLETEWTSNAKHPKVEGSEDDSFDVSQ